MFVEIKGKYNIANNYKSQARHIQVWQFYKSFFSPKVNFLTYVSKRQFSETKSYFHQMHVTRNCPSLTLVMDKE